MSTLQGISSYCGGSLPKVNLVEYVPVKWILDGYVIRPDFSGYVAVEPTLDTGDWLLLPSYQLYTRWREEANESDQGPTWLQTLDASVFNLRPEVNLEFSLMMNYDFILRLKDQNGRRWIMGSTDRPFRFTWSASAGEQNAYNLQFFADSSFPARGFTPDF